MVVLLIAAAWSVWLMLVMGLCMAARCGDAQRGEEPARESPASIPAAQPAGERAGRRRPGRAQAGGGALARPA